MNFYEILKTKKLGRGSPDYWTQLFAEHVGGKGEWTVTELTGTLPMTFRSNGTALINYRIYGTANGAGVQTENLWDVDNWNGATVQRGTMERIGNSFKITATGNDAYTKTYASSTYAYEVTPNEQYTLSWKVSETTIFGQIFVFTGENEGNMSLTSINASAQSVTFTIPNNHHYLSFRLGVAYSGNILTYSDIMLTEGSTTPSTYIPYGYKLPLTIASGTESKDTDIYIGDSKLGEIEYVDYGEQKIYKRILFMTHDNKHFITKDNKDFCLRRRGYSG